MTSLVCDMVSSVFYLSGEFNGKSIIINLDTWGFDKEGRRGVRRFRFRFPIYDFDVFLSPLDNTSSMVKVFGYGSNSSRDRS